MRENPKDAFKILGHLLEGLAKCDTNLAYVGMRGKNMEKLYNTCASFFILYNDVIDDVQHIMVILSIQRIPHLKHFVLILLICK